MTRCLLLQQKQQQHKGNLLIGFCPIGLLGSLEAQEKYFALSPN
jgi:hypothetical protein